MLCVQIGNLITFWISNLINLALIATYAIFHSSLQRYRRLTGSSTVIFCGHLWLTLIWIFDKFILILQPLPMFLKSSDSSIAKRLTFPNNYYWKILLLIFYFVISLKMDQWFNSNIIYCSLKILISSWIVSVHSMYVYTYASIPFFFRHKKTLKFIVPFPISICECMYTYTCVHELHVFKFTRLYT